MPLKFWAPVPFFLHPGDNMPGKGASLSEHYRDGGLVIIPWPQQGRTDRGICSGRFIRTGYAAAAMPFYRKLDIFCGASPARPGRGFSGSLSAHPWWDAVPALRVADACALRLRTPFGTVCC